jgi:virginiamycin A acetyltransferase
MRLEDKLTQIRSRSFSDFTATPLSDDIRQIHTFGRSLDPSGYYFEQQSQLSSPWIVNESEAGCRFIGANSYMNAGGYLRGSVLIGRYCSIGRRVTVGAAPHDLSALSTSPRLPGGDFTPYSERESARLHPARSRRAITEIQSDVWIGDGAVIMPGVTLALGSVVGANAVVVRDTKPYEIVGGTPARPIGRRFDDETVQALLKTGWWEHDAGTLNSFATRNIFEFIAGFNASNREPFAFPTWLISESA